MKLVKNFAFAVLMAMFAINTAQAVAPPGTQLSAAITLQGGSGSALKWTAPLTAIYKIHVFVPGTGTATNALYRVYPKGKQATATTCDSTDLAYPCYEVSVDQTQHKNTWTQLTLNGNTATQWRFVKANGYVTAVASNLSTTETLNLSALVRFEKITLAIGQTYQGGIIFYLDGTKQHGLIAAPTDQADTKDIQWYNGSQIFTGVTGIAVGTGQANTTAIINKQGVGSYAASVCDDLVLNGYSDWFLPSRNELNLMYSKIGQGAVAPLTNVGNFVSDDYWSSSTYGNYFAWYQYFGNGYQDFDSKDLPHHVRAVRAF